MPRHRSNDSGIELTEQQRAHLPDDAAYEKAARAGTLDARDPIEIAGGEGPYADLEIAAMEKERGLKSSRTRAVSSDGAVVRRSGSLRAAGESLRRRIGSLRKSRGAEKED